MAKGNGAGMTFAGLAWQLGGLFQLGATDSNYGYVGVDWAALKFDRRPLSYWQNQMESDMASKQKDDDQGIIGREPAEEAKPAPRVPRRPVEPGPESKTVLDHRAKLAEIDRKRGF